MKIKITYKSKHLNVMEPWLETDADGEDIIKI